MGRPEVGKQQEQLPDEVNGLCGHFRVRIPCTQNYRILLSSTFIETYHDFKIWPDFISAHLYGNFEAQ